MANLSIDHNTAVDVQDEHTYFLTVIIGNGQVGSSAFTNPAGTLITPDINSSLLGKGINLKETDIVVVSEVMQVNPDQLDLIVSYFVSDHKVDNIDNETAADSVTFSPEAGQTILFTTTLAFR